MPPIPPPPGIGAVSRFGASATIASVVISSPATDACGEALRRAATRGRAAARAGGNRGIRSAARNVLNCRPAGPATPYLTEVNMTQFARRRGDRIRRREFITFVTAALAWPVAVAAQTGSKIHRLGLLTAGPPLAPGSGNGALLFRALASRGYVLDRNLLIESRGAMGRIERLPQLVDELIANKVEVIITLSYPAALAAKQRAGTLPIVVMGAGDPVATGLVESLSRPGGHVTGVTEIAADLSAKRLELLKEAVPTSSAWRCCGTRMTSP